MRKYFQKLRLLRAITTVVLMLVASFSLAEITPTEPANGDGSADAPYQISTADELAWFADAVNGGENSINAKLVADIDYSECDKMIGTSFIKSFQGTFDGNGKKVKLNINVSADYAGLFAYTYGAQIENVIVEGSITSTARYVGGIVGYATNSTIIKKCQNLANISGRYDVAGICGKAEGGVVISDCANLGNVSNDGNAGNHAGILGYGDSSVKVKSCYNYGTIKGYNFATGAIIGETGCQVSNCYYLRGSAKYGNNNDAKGINSKIDVEGKAMAKDADAFANGEVAYLLGDAWGQKIGEEGDTLPVLEGAKVYRGSTSNVNCTDVFTYSYNNTNIFTGTITHDGILNFDTQYHWKECKFCGEILEPKCAHDSNGINGSCSICPLLVDGYYQIANATQLAWFAEKVNAGDNFSNAKLVADIDYSDFTTMIGIGSRYFRGKFDGNGKKVKLNINVSADYAGLFAYTYGAQIENVIVEGSITSTARYVGGIVGRADENTIIKKCQNLATICGLEVIAGICGYAQKNVIISDCANLGNVSYKSQKGCHAGILGYGVDLSKVENCYNYGSISGYDFRTGAIIGQSDCQVANCYYLQSSAKYGTSGKNAKGINSKDDVEGQAMVKDAAAFATGEVAYLLGDAWGQTLDEDGDAYPVLDGAKVYKATISDTENGEVSLLKTYCNAGDEVSFVITPNSGYELDKIEGVEVADGKFTMPASDVTIYVSFKESETVTAIDAIVVENTGDDELFDLAGRRVNESYRGLLITKSGKKFLKK